MKTFLSTVVTFLLIISINAQSVSSFFERLEDGDDYAVITINKEMFRMIASFDAETDDEGVKDLIKNIKRVRVFVNDETAEYTDFKELKAISQNFGHESIVTILETYANFKPDLLLKILDNIDVKQPNKIGKQIENDLKKTINELIQKALDGYFNNENS